MQSSHQRSYEPVQENLEKLSGGFKRLLKTIRKTPYEKSLEDATSLGGLQQHGATLSKQGVYQRQGGYAVSA